MICGFFITRKSGFQDFKSTVKEGQAEMPVHLLKFESWNVKAHA